MRGLWPVPTERKTADRAVNHRIVYGDYNFVKFLPRRPFIRYNGVMSKITPDEVRRIATLAHIGLSDDQVAHFATELDQIMGFVEQLQKVNTDGVAPTDQVTGLVDVWREDEVQTGLKHDDLKLNAPDWQDDQFKVKRVL